MGMTLCQLHSWVLRTDEAPLDHSHDKDLLLWRIQVNGSFTRTVVTRSICGSEAFTRRFRNLSTLFAGLLREE